MKSNVLIQKVLKKGLGMMGKNKLKKTVARSLVCVLTAVSVLAGNAGIYKAAEGYDYRTWTTIRINQAIGSYSTIQSLYVTTKEKYEWAVTDYSDPSGGGSVTLDGCNNTVHMADGKNNELNKINAKQFTISNAKTTVDNPYAHFLITMSYDSYITRFTGYIKIIK